LQDPQKFRLFFGDPGCKIQNPVSKDFLKENRNSYTSNNNLVSLVQ
jgi:hypothetical protein